MLKKRILCLVLVLCALLLTACQQKEVFSTELPVKNTMEPVNNQAQATNPPIQELFGGNTVINFDDGSYNPASEEDGDGEAVDGEPVILMTAAPTMKGEYAGATPVLIDPIDKPTPTPLPKLAFTYTTYTASKLHLSFEGPLGWIVDDSENDSFVLTNPDVSMAYPASLTIRVVPVNKNYGKNELTKEVKGVLDTIASSGVKNWEPSQTATRTFLNTTGVYANYKAVTAEGEPIAGRVIVTCVNKDLYILHVTYPRGYTETYVEGVFDKFRHSVKISQ